MTPMALGLPDYLYTYTLYHAVIYHILFVHIYHDIFVFFPTSLCGVLVFDSVSRSSSSSSPPPPPPHTTLSHTTLSHTSLSHTQLCHTHFVTHHLCVAGVALGDNHLRVMWQAWHLLHWAGSGGALGRR